MDFQDNNIESLGLSIRTVNMLKRAGITKLSDLGKEGSAEGTMKLRKLGRKSLKELLQVLKEQGINLIPTKPENESLKYEEKDTEKRSNEILEDSINLLKVSNETIEKIESTTSCTLIKDLWILTPKELCVQTGLNRQEEIT